MFPTASVEFCVLEIWGLPWEAYSLSHSVDALQMPSRQLKLKAVAVKFTWWLKLGFKTKPELENLISETVDPKIQHSENLPLNLKIK